MLVLLGVPFAHQGTTVLVVPHSQHCVQHTPILLLANQAQHVKLVLLDMSVLLVPVLPPQSMDCVRQDPFVWLEPQELCALQELLEWPVGNRLRPMLVLLVHQDISVQLEPKTSLRQSNALVGSIALQEQLLPQNFLAQRERTIQLLEQFHRHPAASVQPDTTVIQERHTTHHSLVPQVGIVQKAHNLLEINKAHKDAQPEPITLPGEPQMPPIAKRVLQDTIAVEIIGAMDHGFSQCQHTIVHVDVLLVRTIQ
mmetsp:Transcript_5857/g.22196  ORF Transcript_5857/g.22196 Transcript_5857/m.22196 type:complete len:254 (-) Transcript_5857:11798-12559(-)